MAQSSSRCRIHLATTRNTIDWLSTDFALTYRLASTSSRAEKVASTLRGLIENIKARARALRSALQDAED